MKDLNSILEGIDNLEIREKDYEILSTLVDNLEPSLFSIIIERILDGDILIEDFTEILSYTNYHKLLEESLESQKELKDKIKLYTEVNNDKFSSVRMNNLIGLTNGAVMDSISMKTSEEFYDSEYRDIIENLVYSLTALSPKDNDIAILCKMKLLSLLSESLGSNSDATESEITVNASDIFFFINNYIIPVDYKYQTLNETDRRFMVENEIEEDTMKQMKMILFLIRRWKFVNNK